MNFKELKAILSTENFDERGVWVRLNGMFYHITSVEVEHPLDGNGIWLNASDEDAYPDLPELREYKTKLTL